MTDADVYQLLGAEVSLYTGKARAYLRYKGIPFREVLATAQVYNEVIVPRTGVRYMPVLISPDDVAVQDTTEIIDFLEARFPEASVYPETPVQRLVALLLEIYGDEWLVVPAMYYRWWFGEENFEFICAEFGKTAMPEAPAQVQRQAGKQMATYFGSSLPFLGITQKNAAAIERWYEGFLDEFSAHLGRHPFLLGTRPSVGDFGFMGPLYAHLYRDPYPGRLMRERAPLVAKWVEQMNAPEPRSGEFLPGDEIPETLGPILRRMFAEHMPVLIDTAKRLAKWLEENPGKPIPRVIGTHPVTIEGVSESRAVFPYAVWMFQRALAHYATLAGEAKERADALLKDLGGYEAMQTKIARPVVRRSNQLEPA